MIRSRVLVSSALAVLAVGAAAGGAAATSLLGSKDIRDDSIRSVDIKNGTLTTRDIRDGSLVADDFTGLPTPTAGPDEVLTWSGSYSGGDHTGVDTPLLVSTDTIPPDSFVRGITMVITGDHTGCEAFDIVVAPASTGIQSDVVSFGVLRPPGSPEPDRIAMSALVTKADAPTHLGVFGACLAELGEVPMPDFDYTVTFSVTQLDLPPTTTWE